MVCTAIVIKLVSIQTKIVLNWSGLVYVYMYIVIGSLIPRPIPMLHAGNGPGDETGRV